MQIIQEEFFGIRPTIDKERKDPGGRFARIFPHEKQVNHLV